MQEVVFYLSYFKNSIAAGTLPRTPLGELTMLLQPPPPPSRVERMSLLTPLSRCLLRLASWVVPKAPI